MSECHKILDMLPAYLEGLASSPDCEIVASHLAACPECGLAVRALMRSQRLIANLGEVEPPPWLKTRVMARLDEGAYKGKHRGLIQGRLKKFLFYPFTVKIPLQVFTVLFVALLAFYLNRTGLPEIRPPRQEPHSVTTVPLEKKTSAIRIEPPQRVEEEAAAVIDEGKTKHGLAEVSENKPEPTTSPQILKKQEMRDGTFQTDHETEDTRARSAKTTTVFAPSAPLPAEWVPGSDRKVEADKGADAPTAREGTVTVSVYVTNTSAAMRKVLDLLRELNMPTAGEVREGSNTVSIQTSQQKAKEILTKLNVIGQVKQTGLLADAPEKTVPVRIQVLQRQP